MSSPLKRLYKRLRRAQAPKNGSLSAQRKRALTLPLAPGAQQTAADQFQSPFFTMLPPEIRDLIYQEVLNDGRDVVHVTKNKRKPLQLIKCWHTCGMEYNYRCSAGEAWNVILPSLEKANFRQQRLLPLLQSCRRVYSELINTLYGHHLFDFRSFDAYLALVPALPSQRWNAIQKVHLTWHFGYDLWPEVGDELPRKSWTWNSVWKEMASMRGLREIDVDLSAYLTGNTLAASDEAEIYGPLMAVTVAPVFVVRVSWLPGLEPPSSSIPFRLVHPARNVEAMGRKDDDLLDDVR